MCARSYRHVLHVLICAHACVSCTRVYASACLCAQESMCAYGPTHVVCVCVCACECAHMCTCLCCGWTCVCAYTCVCLCMCAQVSYECAHVHVSSCVICVCLRVCVLYSHTCVCGCVCTHGMQGLCVLLAHVSVTERVCAVCNVSLCVTVLDVAVRLWTLYTSFYLFLSSVKTHFLKNRIRGLCKNEPWHAGLWNTARSLRLISADD